MVQDISDILKTQMDKEQCSPLCALLIVGGYDYESLRSADKQMAHTNDEQWNKLGARPRGC